MRILVVTFSYRPLNNPRAFRWTELTKGLADHGYTVDVITSKVPGMPEIEADGNLTIYRAGWTWIEALRDHFRQKRGKVGSNATLEADVEHRKFSLKGWLFQKLIYLWRSLHWPDASCLWYFPGKAMGKALLDKHTYDVILSVSPSFTAVAIGRKLRTYQTNARWVLDLGDPFSFLEGAPPNNTGLYACLNKWYERKAFNEAQAVSVTNLQTRNRYESLFPEVTGKIKVIPPLLSLPALTTREKVNPGLLLYVGTLYKNIREPLYLLELFESVVQTGMHNHLQLHFVGDISACASQIKAYQSRLGNRIVLHGLVDRSQVMLAMARADVLINIGNDTTYQLPSKVVEYAASGKRILNLAKHDKDSSAIFFEEYPLALSLVSNTSMPTAEDVVRLTEFLNASQELTTGFDLENWIAPYQKNNILKQYIEILGAGHA